MADWQPIETEAMREPTEAMIEAALHADMPGEFAPHLFVTKGK